MTKHTLTVELWFLGGKCQYRMDLYNSYTSSFHWYIYPKRAVLAAVREARRLGIPFRSVDANAYADDEYGDAGTAELSQQFIDWLENKNKKEWAL